MAAAQRPEASRVVLRYEADNGPLTDEQMDVIRRLQPQGPFKGTKRLF